MGHYTLGGIGVFLALPAPTDLLRSHFRGLVLVLFLVIMVIDNDLKVHSWQGIGENGGTRVVENSKLSSSATEMFCFIRKFGNILK